MSRARRPRTRADGGMSDIAWAFFLEEIPPDITQAEQEELNDLTYDFDSEHRAGGLWREHREQIVEAWITEYPGTRPSHWWAVESTEPRRRLGGTGTPCHERLAHGEHYERGVPDQWIRQSDIDVYALIGSPLDVPALDPTDPPLYESEAAYLERLGLWLPGERRRVPKKDFQPESVLDIFEFEKTSVA
jgi:hypothetical protein